MRTVGTRSAQHALHRYCNLLASMGFLFAFGGIVVPQVFQPSRTKEILVGQVHSNTCPHEVHRIGGFFLGLMPFHACHPDLVNFVRGHIASVKDGVHLDGGIKGNLGGAKMAVVLWWPRRRSWQRRLVDTVAGESDNRLLKCRYRGHRHIDDHHATAVNLPLGRHDVVVVVAFRSCCRS